MKKIGIVIQARINSTRFHSKVLKHLDDKTLIQWIIKRLKKTQIKNIILATGNLKENLKLKKICNQENIQFFKGSEKNVLKRFYYAAKKYKLDAIIRVCADNPFVDSEEINHLIRTYKKTNYKNDYYFNHRNYNKITYADGFGAELFKFSTLEKLYKNASTHSDKEHVTSLVWGKKIHFKVLPCKTNIDKKYHHVVCDINNKNDYKKIKKFIKEKKITFKDNSKKISKLFSLYEIDTHLKDLFNVNRSLAGNENRKTLNYIKNEIPLKIKSFSSGQKVFDWKIPNEWKLKNAYIKDYKGNYIIDIKNNYLHVASYSQSVKKKISFNDLKKKIFTSKLSKAIPYRTLYYKKDWAFCMNKIDYKKIKKLEFKDKKFEICIDSEFKKGKMNYGEILIPGKSKKEILISTYICHPSMANDNLSGVILTTLLARYISNIPNLKWSYRIIFIPETIGAIAYINKNLDIFKKIDFGLNISCVGGKGGISFKESWNPNHFLNQLVKKISIKSKIKFKKFKYDIHGSDERQYSYCGSSINILSIHKDKFYDYKEYHTSLDNLEFVKDNQIFDTFLIYKELIQEIEKQEIYKLKNEYCEPKLSKYNLYPDTGGSMLPSLKIKNQTDQILWILFKTNGKNTISEISEKLSINKNQIKNIIRILKKKNIIKHI